MVTVPGTYYHYYSNPKSTLKQKLDTKHKNDRIKMCLLLLDTAKRNNIDLGNIIIFKERHFLWKIKHRLNSKEYYLLGIKIWTKHIPFDFEAIN